MKKTRRFDNRGKLLWEIAFRSRGVAAANPVELPSRKTKDAESKTSIFLPPPRRKSNFAFTLNCRPKKKKKKINVVPGVDVNLFILVDVSRFVFLHPCGGIEKISPPFSVEGGGVSIRVRPLNDILHPRKTALSRTWLRLEPFTFIPLRSTSFGLETIVEPLNGTIPNGEVSFPH